MKDLYGKSALITGGSSGIGLALAKLIAGEGANVAILARRKDQLSLASQEIMAARQNEAQQVETIAADVSNPKEVNQAIEALIASSGTPDILVNSAGVARPGLFEELEVEIFEWMMNVNFMGTVYTTRAVIPGMMARRSGVVVNISSIAGYAGVYGYTAYGASKFAVRGFTDTLRAEMKPFGIQFAVVFPPDTETPQLEDENLYKPEVTKILDESSTIMSADAVAQAILQGIKRNKYLILPGLDAKLFYFVNNLPGGIGYLINDYLTRQAMRKAGTWLGNKE